MLFAETSTTKTGVAVEQNKKSANLVTSGGRVLAVSAFGATFEEAFKNAYDGMKDVDFNGKKVKIVSIK